MGSKYADWAERVAFGASAVCLVHCLAVPLVLAALPLAAVALPEGLHFWVLLLAVPSSLGALLSGRARYRSNRPLLLGIAGLSALLAGLMPFARSVETVVTVTGSLLLAITHGWNWRLRHAS